MRRLTRRQWLLALLGTATALVAFLGYQWNAAIKRNRSVPDEPFQVAGNLAAHRGSASTTTPRTLARPICRIAAAARARVG